MFTEFDISPINHRYKQIVYRRYYCRMCVYLLNYDLYFAFLIMYVFLHYGVIYQNYIKYKNL